MDLSTIHELDKPYIVAKVSEMVYMLAHENTPPFPIQ